MGLLLSVLLSYVGGIELMFAIRDVAHQVCLHQEHLSNNNDPDNDLKQIQDTYRKSLNLAIKAENESSERMEDGILYENGYRILANDGDSATEKWRQKRKELISLNVSSEQIDEPTNENLNQEFIIKKKSLSPEKYSEQDEKIVSSENFLNNERTTSKNVPNIKTQVGQNTIPSEYSQTSNKPNQNNHSEESFSYDPISPQSSLSIDMPDIFINENDPSFATNPYSDEYLRSLDGIKLRPLVREDGTGRRRAFKKRQQSSSSTSSGGEDLYRQSSREEELKMFTSLEEEEFKSIQNGDFTPIHYSREPNLKIQNHSRRHKKSPVQELQNFVDSDDSYIRNSNVPDETTGEELDSSDPWGDVTPKYFHDTDLWKQERATSIAEENEDANQSQKHPNNLFDETTSAVGNSVQIPDNSRNTNKDVSRPLLSNLPKMLSFEAATNSEHELALNSLKRRTSKEDVPTNGSDVGTGKNVSNAAAELPRASAMDSFLADNDSSNSFACAETNILDNSSTSHTDNVNIKIDEIITSMEKLEDNDENKNDKFQFKEFLEQPKRLRHPSFNFEEKDVLDNSSSFSKSFIEHEKRAEESTVNYTINAINDDSSSSNVEAWEFITCSESKTQTSSLNITLEESDEIIQSKTNKFSSTSRENIQKSSEFQDYSKDESSLENPKRDVDIKYPQTLKTKSKKVVNFNRLESNFSTISLESGSNFTPSNGLTPIVERNLSPMLSRENSWLSNDSAIEYRRSQSASSGTPGNYDDLEYIKGRQDWRDIPNININEEIESDTYHHYRRFSETAETLEYIRGRDDWVLFQERKSFPDIIEFDDHISISVREEIDSDEYHHRRRLSEALDLAHRCYCRDGVRFLVQGSARSGRDRSPYKVLRTDMDKDEFMTRYYWDDREHSTERRSTSRNQENMEEYTMQSDRFSSLDSKNQSRSCNTVEIRIEDEKNRLQANAKIFEVKPVNITPDNDNSECDDFSNLKIFEVNHQNPSKYEGSKSDLSENKSRYHDDDPGEGTSGSCKLHIFEIKSSNTVDSGETSSGSEDDKITVVEVQERNPIQQDVQWDLNADSNDEDVIVQEETDEYDNETRDSNSSQKNTGSHVQIVELNDEDTDELPNTIESSQNEGHIHSSHEHTSEEDESSSIKLRKSKTTRNLLDAEKNKQIFEKNKSSISKQTTEFLNEERQTTGTEFIEKNDQIEENLNKSKNKRRKSRRSLLKENVEDLIKDVTSGPWFHK